MRLLLDIDSVIADLMPVWLEKYNKDYKDSLTKDSITSWDLKSFTKPRCGSRIYTYLSHPGLYDNVRVVEGAKEAIDRLSQEHEIILVTASNDLFMKSTWITKHYIYCDQFVVEKEKFKVNGDILVDDYDKNCMLFPGIAICFDQPWNRNYEGYRALNWNEVEEYVANIAKSHPNSNTKRPRRRTN